MGGMPTPHWRNKEFNTCMLQVVMWGHLKDLIGYSTKDLSSGGYQGCKAPKLSPKTNALSRFSSHTSLQTDGFCVFFFYIYISSGYYWITYLSLVFSQLCIFCVLGGLLHTNRTCISLPCNFKGFCRSRFTSLFYNRILCITSKQMVYKHQLIDRLFNLEFKSYPETGQKWNLCCYM